MPPIAPCCEGDANNFTLALSRRWKSQFPEIVASEPALLAQHCAEAGFNGKAVGYWLKAGQQALARSAMTEAVAQLKKDWTLLASMPEDVARQRLELDLQLALGPALIATQGWAAPTTGQAYARASELCEELGEPHHLDAVLYGLFTHHSLGGALRLAHERAEALRRLGEARNDPVVTSLGHFCIGYNRLILGECTSARTDLEQCLALFDFGQRRVLQRLTGFDVRVLALVHLSRSLASLGYLDQARARREAALIEARQLAHAFTLACTLGLGLATEIERGEGAAVTRLPVAEELLSFSSEHGFAFWAGWGAIQRGWCLSMMARETEGIAQMKQGLASLRSIGTFTPLPQILTLLAEAHGRARQPAEGMRQLAEAQDIIERTQERDYEAEMYNIRGELLLTMGEWAAAEDSYRTALAVARRQSAKRWELRAATSLARLWRGQGKRTEARDLLAPIYGWFTEGFDTPVLKEAKALLDQLDSN